jgi:hypothetical protein
MGRGSGPPNGACIIHHAEDELLIKQYSVPDGEIIFHIQEGNQHTHPLRSFLPDLGALLHSSFIVPGT